VGIASLLTGSRAGWFGLAVAFMVSAALLLASARGRAALGTVARGVTRPGRARIAVGVVAAVAIVGLVAIGPAIVRRATEGGEDLRAGYLSAALRMFAEAPLTGTGPGTWVMQRIRYTVPPETDYYIPHAHDIYAQTLSELGLLGAAAGVVLVVALAWLVRGAMRDPDPVRRRWGWLAAFALVYFGAHQLLDFYANMPAVLFAAALPVAWLDATSTGGPRIGTRSVPVAMGRAVSVGLAAVIVVAVAGLEWSEAQAMGHEGAVAAANAGQWAQADPLARSAATADPGLPPYQLTEGLAAARAGDHARAAEAFRRVVAADDLPEAWLDLAAEQALLGDAVSAQKSISAALRLGYQRPAVALPAGDLALRIGDPDLAAEAFRDALLATPSLAGDPWWSADPARAALFPAVRTAAIDAGGPYAGWEIALETGDYIGARSQAEKLDPASAANADRVIGAWTGDDAALHALLAQCAAHPLDVTALTWCARIEGHAGNDPEANRYRAWANTIIGNAYVAGAELRVNPDVQVGRSDAGNEALFYGYYTYRRPTPWDLLVPDLVHLTLE
jgi:tetratricopeptide (TPR) repeat protein